MFDKPMDETELSRFSVRLDIVWWLLHEFSVRLPAYIWHGLLMHL